MTVESPTQYPAEVEQRLKRVFAVYEAMSQVAKPLRARQRWDMAKGTDSYFKTLYQQMVKEWGKKQNHLAGDPKIPAKVAELLAHIGAWPYLERRVFWARLTGARWETVFTVVAGRQLPMRDLKLLYDQQLLQLQPILDAK